MDTRTLRRIASVGFAGVLAGGFALVGTTTADALRRTARINY